MLKSCVGAGLPPVHPPPICHQCAQKGEDKTADEPIATEEVIHPSRRLMNGEINMLNPEHVIPSSI